METSRRKIVARLVKDGWQLARNGAGHDVFQHTSKPGLIVVPRHRRVSPGVARSIAKAAGWR